jgi:hypothetical protein
MKKIVLLTLIATFASALSFAQTGRVGIGTSTPEQKLDVAGNAKASDKVIATRGFVAGSVTTDTAKAVFATDITNKGFYIPRLTTAEKTTLGSSLVSANKGLLVFDTNLNRVDFWDGTAWKAVGDGAGGPPSGTAGGDLTGTYPNPTIANNAVTGNKILDGTITSADLATPSVNATNQIFNTLPVANGGTGVNTVTGAIIGNGSSAVSGVAASAGNQVLRRNNLNSAYEFAQVQYNDVAGTPSALPPSGAAGGDLTGTYPNPTIAPGAVSGGAAGDILDNSITADDIAANAVTIAKLPSGATGTTFLRGDGTWATPTNTTYTASNGLNISSNDVKLGGTLATNTTVALNSQNLTFSGSGNVGIGTAPSNKLHIVRDAGQSSVSELNIGDGTQFTLFNSNFGPGHYNPLVASGDHGIIFSNGTQNTGNLVIGPWSNTTAGVKVMADGKVGIGTASPATPFHVFTNADVWAVTIGDATSSNRNLKIAGTAGGVSGYGLLQTFSGSTAGGNLVLQRDAGNVGIGAPSPNTQLQLSRASAGNVLQDQLYLDNSRVYGSGAGNFGSALAFTTSENQTIAPSSRVLGRIGARVNNEGTSTEGNLVFETREGGAVTEKMRILYNGNVGIGSTGPNGKLHVNGGATIGTANVAPPTNGLYVESHIVAAGWPAFNVYNNSGGDQSTTGVYNATVKTFDNGNNFNLTTDEFTAPVKGIYQFNWTCYSNQPTGRVFMFVNGGIVMQTNGNESKAICITLSLNANDKVTLGGTSGYPMRWYGAIAHNAFSGHLVMGLP